jgi:urease accessory protein
MAACGGRRSNGSAADNLNAPVAIRSPTDASPQPRHQRTEGAARISFKHGDGPTRLDRLYQVGASKVRLPKVFDGEPTQAVMINTAGGLTGGDKMSVELALGENGRAIVTTQACEKIYRSASGSAEVATRLTAGNGARLDWLPQETILFDGARLARRLEVELAPNAELLLVEAVIFGRAAYCESIRSGLFTDRWRIRRDGKLIFADDLRFDWANAELLGRPAVLNGATAMATIFFTAEEPSRYLEGLRSIIGPAGGASSWNGKLLARLTANGGAPLRRTLIPALELLLDGAALPRIWRI